MENPTAKPKRNYETYFKAYYETHKEIINKRRSTGKPRGRPRKVVASAGYESSSSSDSSKVQNVQWKTETV
jgi:hypothetical protein